MTSAPLSVLVIEDNINICKNIAEYFAAQSATVDFAHNGIHGLELAQNAFFDVIVLDISLPRLDGLAVCKHIRETANRHVPIIMLTARDTLEDKLVGFDRGADDYLTKPFDLEELWVRCLAVSKRSVSATYRLCVGELSLDKQSRRVWRQDQEITLKPIAWQILCYLMEAHPRPVSRSELATKIWGENPTESDSLRSHIYQLRKAVDYAFDNSMVKRIGGVGFGLEVTDDK